MSRNYIGDRNYLRYFNDAYEAANATVEGMKIIGLNEEIGVERVLRISNEDFSMATFL